VNIGSEIKAAFSDKDYVLIDAATGLDRETLNAIDMCDEFIIVTHPELPTISDALRTKSIINKYEKKLAGIVLNRVTKKDELKKDYIASFFKLPVLGVIPEDSSIRRSIELKNPIVLQNPKHKISLEMRKIANSISGKEAKAEVLSVWEQIRMTLLGKPKKGANPQ
jgi:septum site-determining protein MinD